MLMNEQIAIHSLSHLPTHPLTCRVNHYRRGNPTRGNNHGVRGGGEGNNAGSAGGIRTGAEEGERVRVSLEKLALVPEDFELAHELATLQHEQQTVEVSIELVLS